MKETFLGASIRWLAIAAIGFALGYFIADDSFEIKRLRSQLKALEESNPKSIRNSQPSEFNRKQFGLSTNSDRQLKSNQMAGPFTPEDLAEQRKLDERRKDGEDILPSESSLTRRATESFLDGLATEISSNNAAHYSQVFAKLGLDPYKSAQLEKHIEKINRASLEAERGMQEVLKARYDFDRNLQSSLSPEDYSQFRDYESSKPAVHEYENLQKYFEEKQVALNPELKQATIDLVHKAEAYTDSTWHGPYDGLPKVAIGEGGVIAQLTSKVTKLQEGSESLVQNARDAGFPEEYITALSNYYQQNIKQIKDTITQVGDPTFAAKLHEKVKADAEKAIAERQRKSMDQP